MKKKKILLIGIYLEGIYPSGENDVEANLLASVLLKTSADSDSCSQGRCHSQTPVRLNAAVFEQI